MNSAASTFPQTIPQGEFLVDPTARVASLAAWIPAVDQGDGATVLHSHEPEDLHERGEAEVGYLSAPQCFHAGEIQILKCDVLESPHQVECRLEVEILPYVGDLAVQQGKGALRLRSVVRSFFLSGKVLVCPFYFFQQLFKRLRGVDYTAVTEHQEFFHTEVTTRYFGSRGVASDTMIGVSDKDKVEIANSVPLDSQGFDLPDQFAGLVEPVRHSVDFYCIAGDGVTGLFQGEAAKLGCFTKGWRSYFPLALRLYVAEKQGVALLDSLHHILNRLRAKVIPKCVAGAFLQLRDMLHQVKLVKVLSAPSVVAFMQGNTVVPNRCRNTYRAVQFPVLLAAVCLEYKGSHLMRLHCVSM